MLEFDKVLLEFIGGNWMSLYVLITLAKGLALATPSVVDNQIITLLGQAFEVLRGKRTVESLGVASPQYVSGGLKREDEVTVCDTNEQVVSNKGDFYDPAGKK